MNSQTQEEAVNKGFSKIYSHYEYLSKNDLIDIAMRQQVYKHIEHFLVPNSAILEINSGSGIDAVYFAKKGYSVVASDISDGSQKYIEQKIKDLNLPNLSFEKCSFTNLNSLSKNRFDYVFSNFGGINCTENPAKIINDLHQMLPKDAIITLVIMGKYYPWDWIYLLKGKFNRAFIRLKKKKVTANVEGEQVQTYYFSPKSIKTIIKDSFQLLKIENLGVLYPSVNHTSITKHQRWMKKLIALESNNWIKKCIPKGVGDYYIITFQKK